MSGSRLDVDIHEAGLDQCDLNVIASPMQSVRDVFDLMPTDTQEQWATVTRRLGALPRALEQWQGSLLASVDADPTRISARRQVESCMAQCRDLVGDEGFFATFTGGARTSDGQPLPEALAADLDAAGRRAADAYATVRTFLADEAPAPGSRGGRRRPRALPGSRAVTSSGRRSTSRRPTRGARRRPRASTPRCAGPPSGSCRGRA